jgi:hypothetical protein
MLFCPDAKCKISINPFTIEAHLTKENYEKFQLRALK